MKKLAKKHLQLATETIRSLTTRQLREAAGGVVTSQCSLNTCQNHCRQK